MVETSSVCGGRRAELIDDEEFTLVLQMSAGDELVEVCSSIRLLLLLPLVSKCVFGSTFKAILPL